MKAPPTAPAIFDNSLAEARHRKRSVNVVTSETSHMRRDFENLFSTSFQYANAFDFDRTLDNSSRRVTPITGADILSSRVQSPNDSLQARSKGMQSQAEDPAIGYPLSLLLLMKQRKSVPPPIKNQSIARNL